MQGGGECTGRSQCDSHRACHGGRFELKKAYRGASVFDPFKLKCLLEGEGELLIEDLKNFGFPEFTDRFFDGWVPLK